MHLSHAQSSHPLQTIFGGGYVPEQHGDETESHLPAAESMSFDDAFNALRVAMLDELLKALRSALSLR